MFIFVTKEMTERWCRLSLFCCRRGSVVIVIVLSPYCMVYLKMIWMSLCSNQCTKILILEMSVTFKQRFSINWMVSFQNEEKKHENNNNNNKALRWNNWEMIAINSKMCVWMNSLWEPRVLLKCSWRSLSRFVWLWCSFCIAAPI